MKPLLTVLTALLPFSVFAQWGLSLNHNDYEYSMAVVNKDTMVTGAMGGGRIHRTTDGGQNWSFYQTIFTQSSFWDIQFPTTSVGYACGGSAFGTHKEVIAKTTDGGLTWDSLTSNGFGQYNFTKIYFINADTGFVAREVSGMFRTFDGGQTFSYLSTFATVNDICFRPDQTGFISTSKFISSSNYIYTIRKTTDLGATWTTVYTDTMYGVTGLNHHTINEIFFADNTTGYAAGGNGLFMKTTDGGNSWTSSFILPYTNLTALHFTSPNTGYINNAGGIYKTNDGGLSWTVQNIGPPAIIYQLHFANDTIGYASSDEGIYRTTNGGEISGINNPIQANGFSLFPNPASDFITVKTKTRSGETIRITLFSVEGKEIAKLYEGKGDGTEMEIKMQLPKGIPAGIYFLKMQDGTVRKLGVQ